MRSCKKILAAMLVIALMSGTFGGLKCFVVQAAATVVSENFEDTNYVNKLNSADPNLSGTINSTGFTIQDTTTFTNSIKVMQETDNSQNASLFARQSSNASASNKNTYISRAGNLAGNKTILSSRFRISGTNTTTNTSSHYMYLKDTSNQWLAVMALTGNAAAKTIKLFPNAGVTVDYPGYPETLPTTFNLNQWYKLDILLDTTGAQAKMDFYLDNVCIAANRPVPYKDSSTSGTIVWTGPTIRYDSRSSATANTSNVDLDDILWYRSDSLAISGSSPANGAVSVSCATSQFTLNFNNQMDKGSLIPANITVTKTVDGVTETVAGTAYQATNTSYTVNFPELLDPGTLYAVTIKPGVRDLYGQSFGTDTVRSFTTAENTNDPPSIGIVSPLTGTRIDPGSNVAFTMNAADSDGTVVGVALYNGAAKLGDAVLSGSIYTYTWANVPAGNYVITAKATDNRGAVTASTAVNLYAVQNQPPQVTLTAPANSAAFAFGNDITINANAVDPDVSGSISKVVFYDGASLLSEDTQSPYGYTWSNASPGEHKLTAKAYDNEGAVTASAPIWITVVNYEYIEESKLAACDFEKDTQLTDYFSSTIATGASVSVETVQGEANRAVLISSAGSGARQESYFSSKTLANVNGKVLLRTRMRMEDTNVTRTLKITATNSTGASETFDMISGNTARMNYLSTGGVSAGFYDFTVGQWFDLKILMDLNANTADVYVNDQKLISGKGLNRTTSGGNFTSASFRVINFGSGTSKTYYDDIKISKLLSVPTIANYKIYDQEGQEVADKTNAPLTMSKMVVNFSESMNAATLVPANIQLAKGAQNIAVAFTGTYSDTLKQYTMVFDEPLTDATLYRATFMTGVQSALAVAFNSNRTVDFQTEEAVLKAVRLELLSESGEKVTSLSPGAVVRSDVKVKNTGGTDKDVAVMLGLYNRGVLERIVYTKKSIPGNGAVTDIPAVTLTLPSDVAGRTVELYAWDGLESMQAISDVLTVQ